MVNSQKRQLTLGLHSIVIPSAHVWVSKIAAVSSVQMMKATLYKRREFRVNQLIHATEISALVTLKNILKGSLSKMNSQESNLQQWIIQIQLSGCKKRQKQKLKRQKVLRKMKIPNYRHLNQMRSVIIAIVPLHFQLNQKTLVILKKQKISLKYQLLIRFQKKSNKTRILKLRQIIQQMFQSLNSQ